MRRPVGLLGGFAPCPALAGDAGGRPVGIPGQRGAHLALGGKLSALYELTGSPLRPSLSSLYRAGDRLLEHKEALEAHLAAREKDLFDLSERLCLFDLTNTYVEGQAENNPKAKRGHSKEKRSDCKLLTLALVVDEQGFAKYSQLFPGNQAECRTLPEIVTSLVASRPLLARDRTVIIDAGIATKENIEFLKNNAFHYIVVQRGKGDFTPDDTVTMQVIHRDEHHVLEVKRHCLEQEALLLCRSEARTGKTGHPYPPGRPVPGKTPTHSGWPGQERPYQGVYQGHRDDRKVTREKSARFQAL